MIYRPFIKNNTQQPEYKISGYIPHYIIPKGEVEEVEDDSEDIPVSQELEEDIILEDDPETTLKIDSSFKDTNTFKPKNPELNGAKYLAFKYAYDKSGVSKERFSFFAKLAEKESRFNPRIQNSAGYPAWGYFQGTHTNNGRTRTWNNISDIAGVDINTFLNNPILQIQSANKLADKFLSGFNQDDFEKARKMGYGDSALIAGAWLAGVGGVKKFLHENQNSYDVHGTNVKERMDEFNHYFKRGGIIKFDSGGKKDAIEKGKEFVTNWLDNRTDKLAENLRNAYPWMPVTGSLINNITKRELSLADANVESTPQNVAGYYSPKDRKLVMEDSNDTLTSVHEWAHAASSKNSTILDTIKNIMSDRGQDLYFDKNTKPDKYLDDPREVYSRLMEFRYMLEDMGINMNRKFSPNDVYNLIDTFTKNTYLDGKLKKDSNGEHIFPNIKRTVDYRFKNNDLLFRYDPYVVTELLNKVAKSSTKNDIVKAKQGLKLDSDDVHEQVRQWASNKNGELRYALKHGTAYPTFYKLLRDPNRPVLDLGNGYTGTHKLSYVQVGDGYAIYPEIQWTQDSNGKWVGTDYSDKDWIEGWGAAKKRGDYLIIPTEDMAKYFTENYKRAFDPNWYPGFEDIKTAKPWSTDNSFYVNWDKNYKVPIKYPYEYEDKIVENFTPTIEDLARQLTMAYETFQSKPYILVTTNVDGTKRKQELIGHGLSDKSLIEKYRHTGIPKDISEQVVIDELNKLHNVFTKNIKNYSNLPWNVQLAILDAAYNTSGESFWANSKNFRRLVSDGIIDPKVLITELNHSKTKDSWLGDRSAARRALALGKFKWNWKHVDKYGRHLDPNKPVGVQDWKSGLYLGNY